MWAAAAAGEQLPWGTANLSLAASVLWEEATGERLAIGGALTKQIACAPAVTEVPLLYRDLGVYEVVVTPGRLGLHALRVTLAGAAVGELVFSGECPPLQAPVRATSRCGCVAGRQFSFQTSSCEPCAAGTFKDWVGNEACEPTHPGYYQDGEGATAQKPCVPGFFSPDVGYTECVPCEAGDHAPDYATRASRVPPQRVHRR